MKRLLFFVALVCASACCHAQYTIPSYCYELGLGSQPNNSLYCTIRFYNLPTAYICTCQLAVNNYKDFTIEQYELKMCEGVPGCAQAAISQLGTEIAANVNLITSCQQWIVQEGEYWPGDCESSPDGGDPVPAIKKSYQEMNDLQWKA